MLVNATYDDWTGITRPKVQGAWNMHHVFPDLDFFVALASLDGVLGNVGQTIYSGTSVCHTPSYFYALCTLKPPCDDI